MNVKKRRPLYARLVSLLLCAAIAATLIPEIPFTLAIRGEKDGVYYIEEFSDFMGAVGRSRSADGSKLKYVLENDIEFTADNIAAMKGWDIDHLTFGSEEFPFLGEFDGQGHTISGLNYENRIFKVAMRTGLFSYVGDKDYPNEKPYIHNLTIKDASMHADTINGILAGEAYNARFENVTIDSSFTAVNPADNALLLITDGGVIGGGMVGYANDCSFYNCQVSNTSVVVNSVSGVAALAGKGLYLGGLVGAADADTTIEYCRVTGGKVSNRYESSVGALGGFTLYSGGLVGVMEDGSSLIDCFATCNVSFYGATYVGVAAGCTGNVGGLAARVRTNNCRLVRCHYADGTLSSYQYNTLLLFIPVQVDRDIYISGLVEEFDGSRDLVQDCFFNETDTLGPSWGEKPDVLHNSKTSPEYGPQPDERYMDRAFWESHGYDFTGTVDRITEDGTVRFSHTNKWVMYYYEENGTRRGYPVHGQSVAATFDFPGAGTVTLASAAETHLSDTAATTEDPYRFAVLGFYPTEKQVTEYGNGTKTGGVDLSIALNVGYKLVNWYKEDNVTAAGLPEEHGYFERLFAQAEKRLYDLGERNEHLAVEDNQLYVAYCQALVEFHDLHGNVLNVSGVEGANADDYYDYAAPLPDVVPQENAPEGENVKLIGWTTRAYTVAQPGWASVTTSDLNSFRDAGEFYLPGDPILKTLQLYPVYADQLLNIKTQVEGYDDPGDVTLRAGVGQTRVNVEEGKIVLHVQSLADPADQTDIAPFPDGYRFLGWYEDGLCVSRERDYTLPDSVDLHVEHTYEARFEYRVDYYAVARHYGSGISHIEPPFTKEPCAQIWQQYGTAFNADLKLLPAEYNTGFDGWYKGKPKDAYDSDCSGAPEVTEEDTIIAPLVVHEHVKETGMHHNCHIYVTTDFPGSGTVSHTDLPLLTSDLTVKVEYDENYNFLFWAGGRPEGEAGVSDWQKTSNTTPWIIGGGWRTDFDYGFEAHMTANVTFHAKEGQFIQDSQPTQTVQRRYKENVFLNADATHTYEYPLSKNHAIIDTNIEDLSNPPSEAFPFTTDMTVPGYYFIGWLDQDDPDTANARDAIYNVEGDPCTTTNVELAQQYVLKADAQVTHAMPNVYPVYAKYDVKTTTNVFLEITGELNKPRNPDCDLMDDTAAQTTATITAYNHVAVHADRADDAPDQEYYELESITLSVDGGEPVALTTSADHTGDGDNNWTLTYEVRPGHSYLFTAVYKPYVVVYHVNGDVGPKVLLRNYGEAIAQSYLPEIQDGETELDHALFVGWTEARPEDPAGRPYHFFPAEGDKSSYERAKDFGFWTLTQTEDTIVTRSMELWPVFANYTVDVDSNIDQELTGKGIALETVRSLERLTANTISTTVKAAEVEGYKFMGWYTDAKQPGGAYDFTNAKPISDAEEYTLQNEEPFTDKLYTARYMRVYTVNYHGPDGVVYFTDYLVEGQDEGKTLNTTVTETTEITNPDGTVTNKEVTYPKPLNTEPYFQMYQKLGKNQTFGQWYRFTADGTLEPIYKFDTIPIIPTTTGGTSLLDAGHRVLDLYPSIWTVTLRNGSDAEIPPTDERFSTLTGMSQDHTTGDITAFVDVHFNPQKPCTENQLTVHVERQIWTWDATAGKPVPTDENRQGVTVSLFPDATKPHDDPDAVVLAQKLTDGDGNAVFGFSGNDSLLKIVKNAPADRKGETFLFVVTDADDAAKTWTVPVTCDKDVKDAGGAVTGCTGSASLALPVGTYSVTETADWTWGLDPIYTVRVGGELQEGVNAQDTVDLPAQGAEVVCTNSAIAGDQWSWKTDRKENLSKKTPAGGP